MRPPPDRQCHIIRLPYELLKPIIADLSQRDQLSIAKTCVHLWEFAYPLAYDRIVVEASPATANIVWRNLASGVCLRYVRHLEVRASGQSTTTAKKQDQAADVVVGILLGALRRHQLLSFGLTDLARTASMLSTKNLVILLETQQQLDTISLPGISGFDNLSMADYLPVTLQLRKLFSLTLQLSTSNRFDDVNRFVVQMSPSLRSIHLRLSAQGEEASLCFLGIPTPALSSRKSLFSMATKLTIHGYDFDYISISSAFQPTFPALCALAIVDCQSDCFFYSFFLPENMPRLQALMFTVADSISGGQLGRFIGRLHALREIIVYGSQLLLHDKSILHVHAETLEILSLRSKDSALVCLYGDDVFSTLSTLTALRHLNIPIGSFNFNMISGVNSHHKSGLGNIMANLLSCKTLQTLALRCAPRIFPQLLDYTEEEIGLLSNTSHLEKLVGDATLSHSSQEGFLLDSDTLNYAAVTVHGRAHSWSTVTGSFKAITQISQRPTTVTSLRPHQVLQALDQAKQEMMGRYAKHEYHFLEAYIDTMVEASSIKF